MGDAFDALPPAVQAMHGSTEGVTATGRCDVRRGDGKLSRCFAAVLRLPRTVDGVELTLQIVARDEGEEWVRRFGGRVMRSRFWGEHGLLHEQLGPVVLQYTLALENHMLHTRLRRLWFLGMPVPRVLYPQIRAVATGEGPRYRFDVAVQMPCVGLIVSYFGYLQVVASGAAS